MNYEALGDRIVIKPKPITEEIAGFKLMDNDQKQDPIGEVMIVGDGIPLHNITLKIEGTVTDETIARLENVIDMIENGRKIKVKPGDLVHYGQYAGTKVPAALINPKDEDGGHYIVIRESDIMGRIL